MLTICRCRLALPSRSNFAATFSELASYSAEYFRLMHTEGVLLGHRAKDFLRKRHQPSWFWNM
jgi:hypothetical protein